uniref:Nucleotide-diphospho-sugar transferase domain-containing protein n=1 Tax=Eutreptiella gymnastica TaxID=73025 RepID=A0A7S4CLU0_9EUGL
MLRSPWDFLPMRTLWEGACEMRAAKVRNTGLFAMRPGVASLWVLKSVVQHMIRNPDDFDQKVFNKYADRKRLPSFCLSHALDGYGCSRKHWERGGWRASVWALHPTCQIGHSGKKTWLVNHDAWLVPENVSRAMQP